MNAHITGRWAHNASNGGLLLSTHCKSQRRESWKSAPVVNAHLVATPQSGNLVSPSHDNSGLYWTSQGHCRVCRKTWRLTDTDLCPSGETQMMYHIVKYCHLTKLNGGLSQLHSAECWWCCYRLVDQLWILIAHARRRKFNTFIVDIIINWNQIKNNGSRVFEISCYFSILLSPASKNAKIKGTKIIVIDRTAKINGFTVIVITL